MTGKVDVAEKLASFSEPWVPRVLAELNGQYVKVARTEGEFVWHSHENEDELFYVLEGELEIHLRDRVETLKPGQFLVVPRGVEHKPVGTASILLFEPSATRNTGEVDHEHTIEAHDLEHL